MGLNTEKFENNHLNGNLSDSFNINIKKHYGIILLFIIVLTSFIIFMISLTGYPISYGPDGPYYDLAVRSILRTGLPDTNDPPLVYYYLVPFVILTGDSYFGIKIGMSLITSLIAIPTYFLTEMFRKELNISTKAPSLLAAFLITINIYNLRMIEDFMQNLAGIFFLLLFLYFLIKWFHDFEKWKKYGILSFAFLLLTIFTHVLPGLLAISLFASLFLFNLIIKIFKTHKLPKFEILILILIISGGIISALGLAFIFPTTFSNLFNRLKSYLNDIFSLVTGSTISKIDPNFVLFLTIPFFLGIIAIIHILIKSIKEKKPEVTNKKNFQASKKIIISWIYLSLSLISILLVIIPSGWTERFVLLTFIPISLLSPIGLYYVAKIIRNMKPFKLKVQKGIIHTISIIFCIVSLINAIRFIPLMGPIITMEQYDELTEIKDNYIPSQINPDGVVWVDQVHFGYWVNYILDMEVIKGNLTEKALNYVGYEIYGIFRIRFVESPFKHILRYPWFPIFPLSEITTVNSIRAAQPPPPSGLLIYGGFYLELRLLYYNNGTKV